jgi:glycogen debranching enzyme
MIKHYCSLPEANFKISNYREGDFLVHYPVSCSPQAWAAGAPFLMLQAMLGLEFDHEAHRFAVAGA